MYIWDATNIRKVRGHRWTQHQVEEALEDPAGVIVDERIVDGAHRYVQIGAIHDGRLMLVAYEVYDETIRVVTAFALSAEERRYYEEK